MPHSWLLLALLACSVATSPTEEAALDYPQAPTAPIVETLHGESIADPFRPLENSDSDETRAWITAQNTVTDAWFAKIDGLEPLEARLTQLWDFDRAAVPSQKGTRRFVRKATGLVNQPLLYVQDADSKPRVLLDPNGLSADGTVALAETSPSPDGALLAFTLSDAGSDWRTVHVLDTATGEHLEDRLQHVKFSELTWAKDGSGFWYARYDVPEAESLEDVNDNQKLYFHALGTPQADDTLVYERPDHPDWGFGTTLVNDGQTLLISIWQGTERKNRLVAKDLASGEVTELLMAFDAFYEVVGSEGSTLFVFTDKDAPRGRVVSMSLDGDGVLTEVIAEREATLEAVERTGGRLLCRYLNRAHSQVLVFASDGSKQGAVKLPTLGTVGQRGDASLKGHETDATHTWLSFTSFTDPPGVYKLDLETLALTPESVPQVPFTASDFVTTQVMVPSLDSTKVPVFLVHHKNTSPNGEVPVFLYGYGGFNIPLTPAYKPHRIAWMEMGGLLAIANLRGGGEFGANWHDDGRLANKQNVFDDFASVARWLDTSGWSKPERIGIHGRSNGGLLVGASLVQHPELFGAAIPSVGVLDMLRFHLFTIGWAWKSDYGDPDVAEDFAVLRAYSPLHNIVDGHRYPATLITTADHDDRVVPGHSFKFAARLQQAQGGAAPILLRVETRAGHGAGKPVSKQVEEARDLLGFLVGVMGLEVPVGLAESPE